MAVDAERVQVVAVIKARPRAQSDVARELQENAALTRGEEGCLSYVIGSAHGEPGTFVLLEVFTSRAAHSAHAVSPHVSSLMAAINDKLAEPVQVWVLDPLE